jgi:hypothetical protein
MAREFGAQACAHPHEIRRPPPGTRLPLLVLVTPDRRMLALQGHPTLDEVRELFRSLLDHRLPRLQASPSSGKP